MQDKRLWAIGRARHLIHQALVGLEHEGGNARDLREVLDGLSEAEQAVRMMGAIQAPYQPKQGGFRL